MAASCGYDFKYLYRLLRADEHPGEYGISPINQFARVSVQRQILYGTFIKTQFISTAASLEGLLKFARRAKTRPRRIAVINLEALNGDEKVKIYNLNDEAVQQKHLKSKLAKWRVGFTKQVLIKGIIPKHSILCVADKHCGHKFLYRLLDKAEQPVPEKIVAKDGTACVTIEEFVLKGTEVISQFTSTSSSQEYIRRLAASATIADKTVAKINVNTLEASRTAIFIDLTIDENIDRYLKTEAAKSKAKEANEVLIIGSIPKNCIEILDIE